MALLYTMVETKAEWFDTRLEIFSLTNIFFTLSLSEQIEELDYLSKTEGRLADNDDAHEAVCNRINGGV